MNPWHLKSGAMFGIGYSETFLLGILATWVLVSLGLFVVAAVTDRRKSVGAGLARCPKCGKAIPAQSAVCLYCGRA